MLELCNKDDKILEDERMMPQVHNLMLCHTHLVAHHIFARGSTSEVVEMVAQVLK